MNDYCKECKECLWYDGGCCYSWYGIPDKNYMKYYGCDKFEQEAL